MPLIVAGTGAGDATDARVRSEFELTLEAKEEGRDPLVSGLWLEVQSNKRDERFHVWLSVPSPRRHPRGQAVSSDSFGEQSVQISNFRWSKELSWLLEDEADDVTGGLVRRAQQLAIRYSALDMRILVQLLESGSDDDLLADGSPNAYDGSGLYLGTSRYGHASGNVVTGSAGTAAYANVEEVHTDVWAAITRLLLLQDSESNPYWMPEEVQGSNLVLLFPPALVELMAEAFEQEVIFRVDSRATTSSAGAGVSNIMVGGRHKPGLVPLQRLSDTNDIHVMVTGQGPRPFVKLNREPLSAQSFGPESDTWARQHAGRGIMWTMRAGYGLYEPRCAIQISNS